MSQQRPSQNRICPFGKKSHYQFFLLLASVTALLVHHDGTLLHNPCTRIVSILRYWRRCSNAQGNAPRDGSHSVSCENRITPIRIRLFLLFRITLTSLDTTRTFRIFCFIASIYRSISRPYYPYYHSPLQNSA
jgi:hypothetical protein